RPRERAGPPLRPRSRRGREGRRPHPGESDQDRRRAPANRPVAQGGIMTVRVEPVTYPSGDGETTIPSYLATPDGDGPHPVVLILRGVAGPDDGYIDIARRLAERRSV